MVRTTVLLMSLISLIFAVAMPAEVRAEGDMLKPSEIQTTGESSNPTNDSGAFIGGGLTFGQARTTEKGVSPGVAMLFSFEPGYQVNRGSWNRLEFSGQLFAGKAEFGKSDVNIGLGLLAKIGYGYSMGDKLMAMFKFGAGQSWRPLKAERAQKKLSLTVR